jgi:two-component sensor histidine kinase
VRRPAQLAAEQAKTEKAIEAFSTLAQRLAAMAAKHAIKPWWQRLLRRA